MSISGRSILALALAWSPVVAGQIAPIAVTNVTVVDVDTGALVPDQTVVIAGERIAVVGPSTEVTVPAGATVVDGAGRFAIPGLWDMHVHVASMADHALPLFLAQGVTGIRNMHSSEESALALVGHIRDRQLDGSLVGPRFVANGPILDGPIRAQPGSIGVATAEQARHAVDSLADGGAEFVKVYNFIPPEAYFAAVQRARERGLALVGHIPIGVGAVAAADAGQRSVEHLDGLDFACSPRADSILAAFFAAPSRDMWHGSLAALVSTWQLDACAPAIEAYRRNGTWQVPTLAVNWVFTAPDSAMADPTEMAYVATSTQERWRTLASELSADELATERAGFAQALETLQALAAAGVPLLAGTDVGNPFLVPGFSLHRELELLVRGGLSPRDALRAATTSPARFLEREDDLGSIAPGKLADLVVLDGDPLSDITNSRRVHAVISNGRLFDRSALDDILTRARAVSTPD